MKNIYTCFRRLVFLLLLTIIPLILKSQVKKPVVNFFFPSGECAPAKVEFNNMSHTAFDTVKIRFKWFLNNSPNPFHVGYIPATQTLTKGFYYIRVETDSAGFMKESTDLKFEVKGSPLSFKPGNNEQFCPGEELFFQLNEPTNFIEWDFGDNDPFASFRNQSYAPHVYKNAGTYQVKVTFETQCGLDSLKQNIIVAPDATPTVDAFAKGDWNVCLNDQVSFVVNGKYKTYNWNFGDGATSALPNPVHAYSATKQYSVVLSATNICGQTGTDTIRLNVVNNQQAWANFNWWFERNSCPNSPVHFESQSNGVYKWEFGDGGTSNLRNPVNSYTDTGKYIVKLTVTNGCGSTATKSEPVFVKYDPNMMAPPADFNIRSEFDYNKDNKEGMPMDTLKVCPGTRIFAENYSWEDNTNNYYWTFGDGGTASSKKTEHIFNTPGVYNITLKITNNCGNSNVMSKPIKVDNGIKPMSFLRSVPQNICPGEPVYFFDNENDPERSRNKYSIIFGDGSSLMDLTKNTDTTMQTLATHVYQNAGTYNYKFKVTNICGNSDSIAGVVNVQNDAAKVPFYYVDNSTSSHQEGMEDWSKKRYFSDNKIIIPVKWDEWPGTDSIITAFFWWGRFDSKNPDGNGEPAGKVSIKVKNIINNSTDTIVAFVPYDPVAADSFGIAVAWFCNHYQMQGQKAFAVPMNANATPVNAIKVVPGGVSNLGTMYPPGLVFAPNAFTGTCKPSPFGNWSRKVAEGNFTLLGISDNMQYNLTQAPSPSWDGQNNYITGGQFSTKGDTVIFYGGDKCTGTGVYRFAVNDRVITFTAIDDMCDIRKKALAGFTFAMMEDSKFYDRSGCPGDPVEFHIAGGKSYEWHFGDNSPVSTAQKVLHTYADTGVYKAYVVATNACGRKDTIPSQVKIGKYNKPQPYFDMDKYWAKKGDTIMFIYHGNDEGYDPNKYLWDFGDGTTSTIRNATHIYQYRGGYKIKLTVTNGCGSSTNERYIEIGDAFDQCNLMAKFSINKVDTAKLYPGQPVKFMDNSFGTYSKRTWDFGDGSIDTSANPSHTYTKGGIYKVCLSVKDIATSCSDMICMEIVVGEIPCIASYNYVINNSTNIVKFTDLSVKANKWYWDFNDGTNAYASSPVHQYNSPGVYNVCLVTFDTISKCQSKRCDILAVGQIDTSKYCKAEYSFFVNHQTNEVSFKNQSIGKIQKSYWNFSDGLFGYEENPVHKFAKPGVYQVCASIVDSSGCQSSICKEIQVGSIICKSEFSYFVDSTSNKVVFTDNSIGKNLKSFWNFGDGGYSSQVSPAYLYNQSGLYKVCHMIKDSVSGCVSENCLEIRVGKLTCNIDYSYIIDPTTRKVQFKGITNSTILKWNWNFGDGFTDTVPDPVRAYLKDGMYSVCLSVYDPLKKCMADRCKIITIGSATNVVALDADFSYNIDATGLKVQFTDKSLGSPNKYHWNLGDGTSSNLKSPDHVYVKSGVYKVCQTIGDTVTDKISQECKEVYLADKACRADFSFFTGSDGKTVTFKDLSTQRIRENYWDFGNGKFSVKIDAVNIYETPGMYKVCKTIIDSTGCQASICKEIQIGTLACKADFNYLVDPANRMVKFVDNSVGNITNWFWEFGDGSFANKKDTAHVYLKPGQYTVNLYIKNSQTGCVSQISKEIQVGTVYCEAAFSYLVDAVNRTVNLRNESLGNATKFNWSNGMGVVDTLQDAKFTFAADGKYNICLQIYDPKSNCKSNVCKEVVILKDTAKLVSFVADFSYFVIPDSNKIILYDKSLGSPTQYYWTFGNGQFFKGKDASHIYAAGGTYKVCHSIFSSTTGKFDEICKEITVGKEPCSIAADFDLFVDPKTKTVLMSDNSKGSITSWFWRFGDGSTSNKPNPSHVYAKAGYYLISLAVRDTVKGCTDYKADFIQVGTVQCKANFEYTVDMTDNKLSLFDKSLGDLTKYYWQFGDGVSAIDKDPVHTYGNAGLYNVSLIAANADASCRDMIAQPIQVGTINCSAAFEYYVDSMKNVGYFKNKSLGTATKFFWTFGDGSISAEADPIHKFVAPGYYKVKLSTYNPVNGCMDAYEEVVLIGSEGIDCQADFFYQVDDVSKTVKFFDKSAGKNLTYKWNFGDGGTSSSNEPSHVYTKGGYFNVCLTVYAANGVQSTVCKPAKITGDDLYNCKADFIFTLDTTTRQVNFTNKSLGGVTKYLWMFGDGTSSESENPSHTFTKGNYNVKLAVKNETSGCISATMKLIVVSGSQNLAASFGYGLDTTGLKAASGYDITFVGLSSGDPSKYVWDFGDGQKDSTTTSPSHNFANAGTYNVCLTVSDPVTQQSNKYCNSIKVGNLGVSNILQDAGNLAAYPNPFNTSTSIVTEIALAGRYELALYDLSGRKVKVFFNTFKDTGNYWLIWDGNEIENGVYYLKLIKGSQLIKVVKLMKQN